MTTAFLIVNALTVLGFLVVIDRKDKRSHTHALERDSAHRLEVASLCQRLQAPELAVAQHMQESYAPASRTDMPDVGLPLSDEEIAENLESIRRMERDANEVLSMGDQAWDGKP